MSTSIEPLLLNVLFIIVLIIFIPLIVDSHPSILFSNRKKSILVLCAALASITCMFFPISFGNEFFFDLRWVPVILGGIYSGVVGSIILCTSTILFRFLVGWFDTGAIVTTLVGVVILMILIILQKTKLLHNKKKRILTIVTISLFASSFHLGIFKIYGVKFDLVVILAFLSLYLITALLISYLLELIQKMFFAYKQIVKAEKIEVISHLAASISHEVRNPLTVVSGFLQLMSKEKLPSRVQEYINLSLNEITRANEIIVNYLTFAKPAPEKFTKIDLKKEMDKSLSIINPLANMNNIVINNNVESTLINGNAQLLQQCLINILKNSIEAMPNRGNLLIRTERIRGKTILEITDNGIGMTEEQLMRLGEPYFTTKGRFGTGLGLMSVFKIMDMFNGKVEVYSSLNQGTRFCLIFPMVD